MHNRNKNLHFLSRHRYLFTGILCLFGICLLSAQDKKAEPEKKKTRVDLLYADEAQADDELKPNAQILTGSVTLKPISETIYGTTCLTIKSSSVSQCATICLRRFCMIKTIAVTINIVTGINIKMQSPRIVAMSCWLMIQ